MEGQEDRIGQSLAVQRNECNVTDRLVYAASGRSLVLVSSAAAVGDEARLAVMVPLVPRTFVQELSETAEHARPQLCRPPWEGGFGVKGMGYTYRTKSYSL